MRYTVSSFEKIVCGDIESVGNIKQDLGGWSSAATLDLAEIIAADTDPFGQFILAHLLPLSHEPNTIADLLHIKRGLQRTASSRMGD